MVAGASEAAIHPLTFAGFSRMRALSTHHNNHPHSASRPFDKSRDGFVIGEGSGVLILEERDHAIGRNAPILCELFGASSVGLVSIPQPSHPISSHLTSLQGKPFTGVALEKTEKERQDAWNWL